MGQNGSSEQRAHNKTSIGNDMEIGDVSQNEIVENARKLEQACREDKEGTTVEDLLRKGVNPNVRYSDFKCSALHVAAQECNESALRVLLIHPATDANVLDSRGNNVLHVLCMQDTTTGALTQCVKSVLEVCETLRSGERADTQTTNRKFININHCNQRGQTPIFLAAENKNKEVVQILLKHGSKIDTDDTFKGKRTRHLLHDWGTFTQEELPPEEEYVPSLQFLLYSRKEDDFCDRLTEEFAKAHDGRHTSLQTAVYGNMPNAVQRLLDLGADVNMAIEDLPPCGMAAKYGRHEILKKLIAKRYVNLRPANERPVVHECIDTAASESPLSDNCRETFEVLLRHKDLWGINGADENGYTPLHFAINCGVSDFIVRLIEEGALLGVADPCGNIPLDTVSLTDFRKFLDRRISCENPRTPHKQIIFDVQFLQNFDKPSFRPTEQYGCEALIAISENQELRTVLTHPVVTCLLYLKWKAISSVFMFFLGAHFILFLLLLCDVLVDDYHVLSNASAAKNESISNQETSSKQAFMHSLLVTILHYSITIVFAFLAVTTTFYQYVTWRRRGSLEVYLLKLPLALCCIALLAGVSDERWRVTVSVFAVLLSSADLILLMGAIPELSIYVRMLQTVSKDFLKFFLWSSPLLLAFTLGLMSVFGERSGKSFLELLGYWLFKNIIMITGEYESGDLMQSAKTPVLSHAVFILFVFFIAIVLFNLLIALAVSDANSIIENADLLATVSRIHLLRRAEVFLKFLCGYRERKDNCTASSLERWNGETMGLEASSLEPKERLPARRGRTFRFILHYINGMSLQPFVENGKISVHPSNKKKLQIRCSKKSVCLDSEVVKSAENIWKSQRSEGEACLQQLVSSYKEMKETFNRLVDKTQNPSMN